MRWQRVGRVRWSVGAGTAVVVVDGQLEPSDAPSVCAALHAALSGSGVALLTCRGEGFGDPDLATVDLLARLRLAGHRVGCVLRVEGPSPRLKGLLTLAGLDGLLAPCGSGVEARWQSEQRQEPFGVQEGVEPDDRSF
ncbi:MAG: STAS domain-containing protein [Actinomycetota bacterium]|nr:STAS domain-containing protein [Actinomycetota bacterium]